MKISIITTIYKAENDLPTLLQSMMIQKNPDLEFFLIDNGSPDRCGAICEEYAKKDKRFKIFKIEENIGYIRARNLGIEKCDGDYIAFCDSDDYLEPGGYDQAIEKIKKYSCDLYITAYRTIYSQKINNNFMPYNLGLYSKEQVEKIIRPQAFGRLPGRGVLHGFVWKQIYRRKLIVDNSVSFMEKLKPYEDQVFNIDFIEKCNTIYVDDTFIYNYKVNDSSITSKLTRDFDVQEEWKRISLLFLEKKKRVKYSIEMEANCNESMEKIYECVLNMTKKNLSIRDIASQMKDTFENATLNEISKGTSKNQSKISKYASFCLGKRQYVLLASTIRILRTLKGKS